MVDLEFGEHLKVKENAMVAISQIRDQLENAVIAIVDHPPDSCCQIGFHAMVISVVRNYLRVDLIKSV